MLLHAAGRLTAEEADFIPETERPKVYRTARIWLAIYVGARRRWPSRSASWLPLC